ncbi:uncharacterized protein DNG_00926 [Cephalotrichum gorgonifer]|uniref:Uncharacterized protein n=1 Tax=Cephalotrichum gorgonifer TaxID=2041049 RepID=A0AAE8MPL6_9PEZI|nr:uncharacterized protein DNG_00926 [Cephalotrichum gorgonifer]
MVARESKVPTWSRLERWTFRAYWKELK